MIPKAKKDTGKDRIYCIQTSREADILSSRALMRVARFSSMPACPEVTAC